MNAWKNNEHRIFHTVTLEILNLFSADNFRLYVLLEQDRMRTILKTCLPSAACTCVVGAGRCFYKGTAGARVARLREYMKQSPLHQFSSWSVGFERRYGYPRRFIKSGGSYSLSGRILNSGWQKTKHFTFLRLIKIRMQYWSFSDTPLRLKWKRLYVCEVLRSGLRMCSVLVCSNCRNNDAVRTGT